MNKITIGCDPEYIIIRDTQGYTPSGLVPGIGGRDSYDTLCEIRPYYAYNVEDIIKNIHDELILDDAAILRGLEDADKGYRMKTQSLNHPVGGHIHIGGLDDECQEKFVFLMDVIVAFRTAVTTDRERFLSRIEEEYGCLSNVEDDKPHDGFEYRTLGSWWLNTPNIARAVLGMAMFISESVNELYYCGKMKTLEEFKCYDEEMENEYKTLYEERENDNELFETACIYLERFVNVSPPHIVAKYQSYIDLFKSIFTINKRLNSYINLDKWKEISNGKIGNISFDDYIFSIERARIFRTIYEMYMYKELYRENLYINVYRCPETNISIEIDSKVKVSMGLSDKDIDKLCVDDFIYIIDTLPFNPTVAGEIYINKAMQINKKEIYYFLEKMGHQFFWYKKVYFKMNDNNQDDNFYVFLNPDEEEGNFIRPYPMVWIEDVEDDKRCYICNYVDADVYISIPQTKSLLEVVKILLPSLIEMGCLYGPPIKRGTFSLVNDVVNELLAVENINGLIIPVVHRNKEEVDYINVDRKFILIGVKQNDDIGAVFENEFLHYSDAPRIRVHEEKIISLLERLKGIEWGDKNVTGMRTMFLS